MLLQKSKKSCSEEIKKRNNNRLLITVTVLGSAGPLRFLVNEKELVASVINTALKSYAREGRLPVLGTDLNNFYLYCVNAGSEALSPLEAIGSRGGRNFLLCKKQRMMKSDEGRAMVMSERMTSRSSSKGSGSWKAWLNKSLTFKISSH